jgi:arylsulfatase A-like enzyme
MKPNIVLIVADTARASNFSLYGYGKETSPNLESIAANNSLYTNAIATAPWTMPSHASIFTGLYSSHHGSTRSSPELSDDKGTLHRVLADNGYCNWLITANPGISAVTNGEFEEYLTRRLVPTSTDYTEIKSTFRSSGISASTFKSIYNSIDQESKISDIINLADKFILNQLEEVTNNPRRYIRKGSKNDIKLFSKLCNQSNAPYFAYVNIMEPHLKYIPPKGSRRKFVPDGVTDEELWSVNQDPRLYNYAQAVDMDERDFELLGALYNGAIHYTDHLVKEMYDHLKLTGQLEDTLFIFIGDHGENIGDRGRMGHSLSLNDALLRVPMVISYPGDSGGVFDQLVQLHDLFPTILRESGIDGQALSVDHDAMSLPRDESHSGREYAVAEYLGSPFAGITNVIEEYPDVDYSQYDYEIKTIYSDQSEKLTVFSTGESEFAKVSINGETRRSGSAVSDRKSILRDELFSRVRDFGSTEYSDECSDLSNEVENKLKNLGYI